MCQLNLEIDSFMSVSLQNVYCRKNVIARLHSICYASDGYIPLCIILSLLWGAWWCSC